MKLMLPLLMLRFPMFSKSEFFFALALCDLQQRTGKKVGSVLLVCGWGKSNNLALDLNWRPFYEGLSVYAVMLRLFTFILKRRNDDATVKQPPLRQKPCYFLS